MHIFTFGKAHRWTSPLGTHSGVDNLVLSSTPGRYATVQGTRNSAKRHCNTEGKVFDSKAKTRTKVAIIKCGTIYCLGCTQRNCKSQQKVTIPSPSALLAITPC